MSGVRGRGLRGFGPIGAWAMAQGFAGWWFHGLLVFGCLGVYEASLVGMDHLLRRGIMRWEYSGSRQAPE